MKVKIDTKEKFHVITIQEPFLSANMTEELNQLLLLILEKEIKNVVLKMSGVKKIDDLVAIALSGMHQKFYRTGASLVFCELNPAVKQCFKNMKSTNIINIAPTESEAWDIVQLEEIERELLE